MNTLIFLCCHLPAFLLSAVPRALGSRAVGFLRSTLRAAVMHLLSCVSAPQLDIILLLLHWGRMATPLENHRLYVTDNQSSLLAAIHRAGGTS